MDITSSPYEACDCCFLCILKHEEEGCEKCINLMKTYFPKTPKKKLKVSVANTLREAISELFTAMNKKDIVLDKSERVSVTSFIKDFCKMTGEINDKQDIIQLWSIEDALAENLFDLLKEVVFETEYEFEY